MDSRIKALDEIKGLLGKFCILYISVSSIEEKRTGAYIERERERSYYSK